MPEAAVVNLDSVLGRAKNRIYRVGVELEGAWRKLPPGVNGVEHDGSVKIAVPSIISALPPGHPDKTFVVGELVSPILELDKVEAWMLKHYPSDVNSTCGLHVHVSFVSALHYQRLMDESLTPTVLEYLKRWAKDMKVPSGHCLWERLKGTNQFCLAQFCPDAQVTANSKIYNRNFEGHRYTVINYCHGLHGTIECRVLPMMKLPEHGVLAVKEVIRIFNAFLAKSGKKERRERVEVGGDFDELVEIMEIHPPVGVVAAERRR